MSKVLDLKDMQIDIDGVRLSVELKRIISLKEEVSGNQGRVCNRLSIWYTVAPGHLCSAIETCLI